MSGISKDISVIKVFDGNWENYYVWKEDFENLLASKQLAWVLNRDRDPYPIKPRDAFYRYDESRETADDVNAIDKYKKVNFKLDSEVEAAIALLKTYIAKDVAAIINKILQDPTRGTRSKFLKAWEYIKQHYGRVTTSAIQVIQQKFTECDVISDFDTAILHFKNMIIQNYQLQQFPRPSKEKIYQFHNDQYHEIQTLTWAYDDAGLKQELIKKLDPKVFLSSIDSFDHNDVSFVEIEKILEKRRDDLKLFNNYNKRQRGYLPSSHTDSIINIVREDILSNSTSSSVQYF